MRSFIIYHKQQNEKTLLGRLEAKDEQAAEKEAQEQYALNKEEIKLVPQPEEALLPTDPIYPAIAAMAGSEYYCLPCVYRWYLDHEIDGSVKMNLEGREDDPELFKQFIQDLVNNRIQVFPRLLIERKDPLVAIYADQLDGHYRKLREYFQCQQCKRPLVDCMEEALTKSVEKVIDAEDIVLSPAQAYAAWVLADRLGHLWAAHTRKGEQSLKIIEMLATPHRYLSSDVVVPEVRYGGFLDHIEVRRTTGSGRLYYRIFSNANIVVDVFRKCPEEYQGKKYVTERGLRVASIRIINDNSHTFNNAIDDVECVISKYELHQQYGIGTTFLDYEYVNSDLLGVRHVNALKRFLMILMNGEVAYPVGEWTEEDRGEFASQVQAYRQEHEYPEDYPVSIYDLEFYPVHKRAWYERYQKPAAERAEKLLQPLYEIAHQDPISIREEEDEMWADYRQEPHWRRYHLYESLYREDFFTVHHLGQSFPVQSEAVACHTVQLLRLRPNFQVHEAVKVAILAGGYTLQPGEQENLESYLQTQKRSRS